MDKDEKLALIGVIGIIMFISTFFIGPLICWLFPEKVAEIPENVIEIALAIWLIVSAIMAGVPAIDEWSKGHFIP